MPEVVLDANVVLDARNRNATRHETARPIFEGIDRRELPRARVANYTIPEILHPIQKRGRKEIAVETLEVLQESRGFDLVDVPQGVHAAGERLYRLHDGADSLEWVDAMIAAYTLSEGLEYVYSFDDEFDSVEGMTRLHSAADPFA
jgi:predicted nucleic acid-binding protein